MKGLTNEIKAGTMVIASLVVLLVLFYKMGNFDFTRKGYRVDALFNFAGGIAANAPVRLLGVKVGKVENINLQYNDDAKVLMILRLDRDTQLHMDAKAYISSLGLMGEKYVELNPGSKKAPLLKPGGVILGEDPFQIERLTAKSEEIMEKLGKALTDIRSLTTNLDGMITENRDDVRRILENVEYTTDNLRSLSGDLRRNPWKIIAKPRDWKQKM